MLIKALLMVASVLLTGVPAAAQSHAATDADTIRHVLKSTFDTPTASVEVSPVVVASDYALAGWTQGEMGGRALIRRRAGGWAIILCAGDQLRNAETLRAAGVAAAMAERLTADLAKAESQLPPERVAMFSRFEGLVTMDTDTGRAHGH